MTPYMFRTVVLSIIRSSRLHTATGICQTDTAVCLLVSRQQCLFDRRTVYWYCCLLRYCCLLANKQIAVTVDCSYAVYIHYTSDSGISVKWKIFSHVLFMFNDLTVSGRAQLKPDGTWWCMVGEVKGKHASGMGSQWSCTLPQNMVYPALLPLLLLMRTPRLPVVDRTPPPSQFKWTRPFHWKTKSGFCACAIMFQTFSTNCLQLWYSVSVLNTMPKTYCQQRQQCQWQ